MLNLILHVVRGASSESETIMYERRSDWVHILNGPPSFDPPLYALLRVDTLQEQLDKKLLERQALETGICPVREDLYTQAFGKFRCPVPPPVIAHRTICLSWFYKVRTRRVARCHDIFATSAVETLSNSTANTAETEIGCPGSSLPRIFVLTLASLREVLPLRLQSHVPEVYGTFGRARGVVIGRLMAAVNLAY